MIKQKLFLTIALLLGTLAPHSVLGYDFYATAPTGQRLYYTITDSSTHTVSVVPQNSSSPYYSSVSPSGVLEIPASVTYNGTSYSVTSIGYAAFYDCSGLTGTLTIPNSVTSIEAWGFGNCSGLTSATIANSVTSIGKNAFRCCTGLTSVSIPNSVTTIGCHAFDSCINLQNIVLSNNLSRLDTSLFLYCRGLTSITIPNSVTSIGYGAFYGCTGLTSVTIPNSVNSIGSWSFGNCSGLTSVTIGNSVTSLNLGTFQGCTGLTSVTLGNSVTSIGQQAFYGCTGLTSITIPDSVTSIGKNAFRRCTGLTSVSIPNSVTTIGCHAFDSCISLQNIVLSNNLSRIDTALFQHCTGLTSITIPNSVTSIMSDAFVNCSSLTSVTIPNSVARIGNYAFWYCTGLTSVTIPNSVTSIGEAAFYKCTSLTSVTIPNSVISIGTYTFYSVNNVVYNGDLSGCPWGGKTCNGYIEDSLIYSDATKTTVTGFVSGLSVANIPNSVTLIGNNAFDNCTSLTSVTNPNSVTSIGNYAFFNCTGLTGALTIPNSVTSIGNYAFYNCTGLTSITIPNSVTSIGEAAFDNCSGLTSITIGNSVTSIGDYTFYGCTGLTSVTIPNSVTSIGNYAFYNCTGLTSITIPNSVTDIGYGVFRDCTGLTSINYNAVHCEGYGFTSYNPMLFQHWLSGCSALTTVTIGNSVEYIPSVAFWNCTGLTTLNYNAANCSLFPAFDATYGWLLGCTALTTLNIGNDVEGIHNSFMSGCRSLTSVTIGNSVTSIGQRAFYGCTGLTSVTIPNSVTSIGNYAFYNCTGLTGALTIPNSVTSIGDYAFCLCTGLTNVTIGNSVTSIGEAAFKNCTGLTTINYNATNCSGDGFTIANGSSSWLRGCSSLTRVNVGNNVRSIPENAFYNCTSLHVLDLGSGLTSVGANAFYNCDHLDSIYSRSTTPPTVANTNAFENVWKGLPLTVPTGSRSAYAVAYAWRDFTNIVEMSAAQFTVTVNVNDASMGTVSGGGSYALGATVTLTATPNTGYHFVQWSDGNTQNPRTVTVTGNATYVAQFVADQSPNQYTVTVYANDATMGYVTGSGSYTSGTTATLTATANTGYHFVQWNDGITANPRTITVTANATYMALFGADQSDVPQIAYVGVDANGHNSVCWLPRSGSAAVSYRIYSEGTQSGVYEQVGIVQATGAASYTWSDDQSNPAVRAYSYRLTEVAADGTESAQSAPHTTMHLQINQGQGGAWNLTWTPYAGFAYSTYRIYRGAMAASLSLLTTLPASSTTYSDLTAGGVNYYYQIEVVQLNGNKSVTGNSRSNIANSDPEPQRYTLTVLSADITRGTVTGGGSYEQGETATLEAQAAEGYVFLQWQDGSTANPRTITVTADATYMAYFTQTEGIADAEGSNVTITARNGRILVSGAEGRQVTLSDALGRILYCGTATESLTVEAPATGIYLLQVEGHPAHRISVVR